MKLLDTSVVIDHLRGLEPAVELVRGLAAGDEPILASEVVRFELLAGARDEEIGALEQVSSVFTWLEVDEPVARGAAALARRHRAAYAGIDDIDYLIAATTLLYEAELLTTNVRHFPMLAGLRAPY